MDSPRRAVSFPLIIMAAPRPAPNWHSCIASAALAGFDGPIIVCVDGDVSPAESELYDHLYVTALAREYRPASSPRVRALCNAIRCFRHAAEYPFTVVVEDDVTFADGWATTVQDAREHDGDPVLLGYCREEMTGGGGLLQREATWDATLFVGVSGKRAREAATALETSLAVQPEMPADNALSLHWRTSGTRRLTFNPSLVQHLGDAALVNPGDGRRRAPSFTGRA